MRQQKRNYCDMWHDLMFATFIPAFGQFSGLYSFGWKVEQGQEGNILKNIYIYFDGKVTIWDCKVGKVGIFASELESPKVLKNGIKLPRLFEDRNTLLRNEHYCMCSNVYRVSNLLLDINLLHLKNLSLLSEKWSISVFLKLKQQ